MNFLLQGKDRLSQLTGELPFWYAALAIFSCAAFVATQSFLAFLPAVSLLLVAFLLYDIRRSYLLLFLCIPLSTEVYLPMGLGTDFPTEQFMWVLTGIGALLFIFNWNKIAGLYVTHPISIVVLLMLSWVFISAIFSEQVIQSFKYFLARFWYVVALFCMTLFFIRSKTHINELFKYFFTGLLFTVLVIVIRHGLEGFTYESANFVLWPFYRNHVNYACLLAISLPYFYWYSRTRKTSRKRLTLLVIFIFLLVALYFTYTRAAILASLICPVFYVLVRKRLVMPASILALIMAISFSVFMIRKYGYLAYAPNYAATIQHQEFDDVLSATYRLEDLSTMERFYRWIAGYRMIKEKPILGFGPANFYTFYKSYTITSFTTYVSDNKDRSGIHNYYLMLLVEQGIPGLLIFLALIFLALYHGQRLYHSFTDPFEKTLILAALGSIAITLIISVMNDMLETDKVGTLFLFSLALLVRGSVLQSQKSNSA